MSSQTPKQSLSSLLRHYVHSNHVNINKCAQLITQISDHNECLTKLELKQCKIYLSQIISKCNDTNILKRINASIQSDILQNDTSINTALMKRYGKYCNVSQALHIYNCIQLKNAKIVKSMMTILLQNSEPSKALSIYNDFNDFSDDTLNIVAIKACSQTNQFDKGKQIIWQSNIKTNHKHLPCKTSLIDFYGKSGHISDATHIFSNIDSLNMNVFIIGCMMKAYINNAYFKECLQIYDKYDKLQDDLCHLLAIKACLNTDNLEKGKKIHCKINLKTSKFQTEISNALIEFYAHFKQVDHAYNIFKSLHLKKRNDVVINTMIRALISNNCNQKALSLYEEYKSNNNNILHLLALKICINLNMNEYGKQIHHSIPSKKLSVQLKAMLIDFYAHFKDVDIAMQIFDSIEDNEKTTVSVGAIMSALIHIDYNDKALEIYDNFCWLNDDICHNLAIKACINMKNVQKGKQIDKKLGMNNRNIKLKNALISFYGSFGDIENGKKIFDSINDTSKDIVTLSAMMHSYCNANMNEECIELFKEMDMFYCHVRPDAIAYAIVFKACTQGTAYHFGHDIHHKLKENNNDNQCILNDLSVQINLINMYGKCGMLDKCDNIFETSKYKSSSVDLWNAIICCFGRNGDINRANEWYDEMKRIGLKPNVQTYKMLLNGCSHCGDVIRAEYIWNNIQDDRKYDPLVINPFIDCICRKGMLIRAKELILQFNPNDEIAWTSLLNGYQSNNSAVLNAIDVTDIYEHIVNVFGYNTDLMRLCDEIIQKRGVYTS